MTAIGELWATLQDVGECGDLVGHLRAWWEVVRGRVTPDDPAGAVILEGADDLAEV